MSLYGFIFAVLFAYIGAAMENFSGFFFGAILGYAFGGVIEFAGKYKKLQATVQALLQTGHTAEPQQPSAASYSPAEQQNSGNTPQGQAEFTPPVPTTFSTPPSQPEQTSERPRGYERDLADNAAAPIALDASQQDVETVSTARTTGYVHREDIFDRFAARIQGFFSGGNLLAYVGIIVTFFGIGFLVKLAAERDMFPLELRFAFAALIGIILLVLGWRLRNSRTVFGLILQGGGVGTLYITVFAAAKVFQLVPLGFALIVMIALVAFSAILAVLQNAKSLAIFGAVGGFLAPILTSTGGGNHVALDARRQRRQAG